MTILYLCIILAIVLGALYFVPRIIKLIKQKFMATLQDFQAQIDGMNTSLTNLGGLITTLNTEVTDLTAKLVGVMPAADADAALAGVKDVATKLAVLVPPTPQG
jgi:hypothetical protein